MSERSPEVACALEAERNHGLILRKRALALGLSPSAIGRLLESGKWALAHRGVYSVTGNGASPLQKIAAAVMVQGPEALAMYNTAAFLWGMPGARPTPIHGGTRRRSRMTGMVAHQIRALTPRERATRHGVATTSVDRTLLELGAVAPRESVEDAIDYSIRKGLTVYRRLVESTELFGGAGLRGSGTFRAILEENDPSKPPPSWLERRFLSLFERAGLPPCEREYPVLGGKYRVDFAWPHLGLGVEAQSFRWHFSRADWERDIERLNEITAAGLTLLPFTYRQLWADPLVVVQRIQQTAGISLF